MKKVLLIAVLLAGAVSFTKAQGGGGGGGGGFQQAPPAERATAFFANQRNAAYAFTDAQKAKLTPLLVKFYTSSDSLRATIPAGGDMRAAMTALQPKTAALAAPYEAAMVAVLTPDQKKAYDTALAAAKERNPAATGVFTGGGGGRGGQGGGGGGQGGGGNRPAGGGAAPATPPSK